MSSRSPQPSLAASWVVALTCLFVLTAPGRVWFPDDEVVFQTSRALWLTGDPAIAGIPKRTGEPEGRPDGSFGVAEGRDGRRYGFFGRGLAVVALPLVALGDLTAERVPPSWSRAVRSDHYSFHRRSHREDWVRLLATLTNAWVTALTSWWLVAWVRREGFSLAAALFTGAAFAVGTLAWPYAGTFLSEPLSAACLVGSALHGAHHAAARREARPRAARVHLWLAAAFAGASVHVHVLNVIALPWLAVYALAPLLAPRDSHARGATPVTDAAIALVIGAAIVGALALGQWWRFGDPLETGRFDHYSHFVAPWPALAAFAVAPGRALAIYAPMLAVAALAARLAWQRAPRATALAVLILATRVAFVACRSDWWGGWSIGPRYLVPAIPLALVPLAAWWDAPEEQPGGRVRRRVALLASLGAASVVMAHLARYSPFEHMYKLSQGGRVGPDALMPVSHWEPLAAPPLAFFWLDYPDTLTYGALRLARAGHPSALLALAVVAALGVIAGLRLALRVRALARAGALA